MNLLLMEVNRKPQLEMRALKRLEQGLENCTDFCRELNFKHPFIVLGVYIYWSVGIGVKIILRVIVYC